MGQNYKIANGELVMVDEFEGQPPATKTSPDDFANGIVAAPTEEESAAEDESIQRELDELAEKAKERELTYDEQRRKKELEDRQAQKKAAAEAKKAEAEAPDSLTPEQKEIKEELEGYASEGEEDQKKGKKGKK